LYVREKIIPRNNSKAYPIFLQNVNTKDISVCVALGPRQVTCRKIQKLKLGWGQARHIRSATIVRVSFLRSEKKLTRNNSKAYRVFLQNVNTKDTSVFVALGPRQVTWRQIQKLKLLWGYAR